MANTGRDDAASTLGAQLSSLPPGPDLAALIASIDVTCVDDECDLADVVAACARLTAWSNAKELAAIAEFARRPWPPIADPDVARSKRGKLGEVVREFVADEIAAALSISPGAARFRVKLATTLAGSCRATAAALAAGLIDVPKARAIADGCLDLDLTTAAEVEAKVLADAPSQTTATLKRAVRKAVISADPAAAQQRAAAVRSERGVWLTPLDDGMAALYAVLAAEDALTVHNVLSTAAQAAKAVGRETRTTDQLRADYLLAPFYAAMQSGELAGITPIKLAKHRGRSGGSSPTRSTAPSWPLTPRLTVRLRGSRGMLSYVTRVACSSAARDQPPDVTSTTAIATPKAAPVTTILVHCANTTTSPNTRSTMPSPD